MKCKNIKCNNTHNGSFGSGLFCSRSCSNTRIHNQKTKDKISKTLGGLGINRIINCLYCNKKLRVFKCKNKQKKYCNQKCYNEHQHKLYIDRWKNGLEDAIIVGGSTSVHIHRYIREKYNNKCIKCGWKEIHSITGNIPVQLEHKDGNWKNNKEENLSLLCPNCHSLTETYCALNKGKGRGK